jgi:hypothetical protein
VVALPVAAALRRDWSNPVALALSLALFVGIALFYLLVILYLWRRGEFPIRERRPNLAELGLLLATNMAVLLSLCAFLFLVTIFLTYIPKIRTEPVWSIGSMICAAGICIAVLWVCRFTVRSARKECQDTKRRPT